jgi:hypothetical protein
MFCAALAFLGWQQPVGIDLALKTIEERRPRLRGDLTAVVGRVEPMGADAPEKTCPFWIEHKNTADLTAALNP